LVILDIVSLGTADKDSHGFDAPKTWVFSVGDACGYDGWEIDS
jgi:hypothetical protein